MTGQLTAPFPSFANLNLVDRPKPLKPEIKPTIKSEPTPATILADEKFSQPFAADADVQFGFKQTIRAVMYFALISFCGTHEDYLQVTKYFSSRHKS